MPDGASRAIPSSDVTPRVGTERWDGVMAWMDRLRNVERIDNGLQNNGFHLAATVRAF